MKKEESPTCCLQRFNCCFIPFVGIFICSGLFVLIIVASKLEDSAKHLSWKETTLFGNAFRIDSQRIVVPISRLCNGPELLIQFFTFDNIKITFVSEIQNSCGSSLSTWLSSSSPTELSLNYLNTASDDFHVVVMEQDFVYLSVYDSQDNISNNISDDDPAHVFTVCILPSNNKNDEKKISPKILPEIAAFFESWNFYHASQFIIYDLKSLQNKNNSDIFELYSNNNFTIIFPFETKKDEEKLKDNLLYVYDCFYNSRYTSKWIVLTTFENIPMVQTRSSLSNILSIISTTLETKNLVFQISNVKSEEPTTTIFDGRLIDGFDAKLEPIFKHAEGKITQIPVELIKTYNLLQLNSELFQQANTSAMNQIFSSWNNQYNLKQLKYSNKFNETL